MTVQLKKLENEGYITSGKFLNYTLEVGGLQFAVVCFHPTNGGREVLSKITVEGEKLFHAKEVLSGRGQLAFLREVNGYWVAYRLIGCPHNPCVDQLWLVTEQGVHYPIDSEKKKDVETAIELKHAIARKENCKVALTSGEQAFSMLRELEAEQAAAKARREAMAARVKEQAVRDKEKRIAKEQRSKLKASLRAIKNRRSFQTTGGRVFSGFVVANREQAKMLDNSDVGVIVSEDGRQVVTAWRVNKTKGGNVSLSDIIVDEEKRPASSSSKTGATPVANYRLDKKGIFQRPAAKQRKEDCPFEAYYATEEQFAALREHRPEEMVTVVVQTDGVYKAHRISKGGVHTLGIMERMVTKPNTPASTAESVQKHRFLSA